MTIDIFRSQSEILTSSIAISEILRRIQRLRDTCIALVSQFYMHFNSEKIFLYWKFTEVCTIVSLHGSVLTFGKIYLCLWFILKRASFFSLSLSPPARPPPPLFSFSLSFSLPFFPSLAPSLSLACSLARSLPEPSWLWRFSSRAELTLEEIYLLIQCGHVFFGISQKSAL